MSDFDSFSLGYLRAAIDHAEGIWNVRDPNSVTIDEETGERMTNEAARFYDSHWHTLRNLIKRGLRTWETAGRLFYKSRATGRGYFYNRPGESDRAREDSEAQAIKLDEAAQKRGPFRLRAKANGQLHGVWG